MSTTAQKINRLYDFTAGTPARSQEVDDEFNQIITEHNNTIDDIADHENRITENENSISNNTNDITELQNNKADKSSTYTKTEVDNKIWDTTNYKNESITLEKLDPSIQDTVGDAQQNAQLADHEDRITTIEGDIKAAEKTGDITQNVSIFTAGTGYDENGQYVDYSSNVKGQVSDIRIQGRTVPNLEVDGDCEDAGNFIILGSCSIALDSTSKVFGSNSIQVTTNATGAFGSRPTTLRKIDNTKYYLATAYIKNVDSDYFQLYVLKGSDSTLIKGSSTYTDTYFRRIGVKLSPTDLTGESEIALYCRGYASETGQKFNFDGLMLNEITQDEYNNLTEEELMQRYQWHNGTKSTVCAYRIKTRNENIFDEKWKIGAYISVSDGKTVTEDIDSAYTNYFKVKSNTDYICTIENTVKYILFYDINKNYISYEYANKYTNHLEFTTPTNCYYIRFTSTDINTEVYKLMIVEGTQAPTEYEEYKESVSYIYATDENGNVIKLNSLPNGTKDEISITEGKLTKNTWEKVLQSADVVELDTTTYTSFDVVKIDKPSDSYMDGLSGQSAEGTGILEGYNEWIGSFSDSVDLIGYIAFRFAAATIWYIVEKGTYPDLASAQADLAGTTLIYQLAEPKIYDIDVDGTLEVFENGTIEISPYFKKEVIYDSANGGIVFDNPVSSIEKVWDGSAYIDLDNVTLAEDGLTATISDASDGDIFTVYAPYRTEISTVPTTVINYDTNLFGQVKSNTAGITTLSNQHEFDTRDINMTLLYLTNYIMELEDRIATLEGYHV